ncbi:hypothetical protein FKR81_40465 [Lentzea tibetensis]|uniref:Acetyl-coenzyme A carboxylase carboxyl transferase subunit beta domain-containing protein n=1 Tax=Lentzea tibetensis TaxID=2591470 RepID=A0A563EHJ9_9PSEU|nr:carboxyl transferase domain-containing protein [Lentzea tibetensis]TWP44959.1 hypothetical protein FKR81_40465 [Lentzea tibetensis]
MHLSAAPQVTLVSRKTYRSAYVTVSFRLLGATAEFAWPSADMAVTDAKAAVAILRRQKHTWLAEERERSAGDRDRADDRLVDKGTGLRKPGRPAGRCTDGKSTLVCDRSAIKLI